MNALIPALPYAALLGAVIWVYAAVKLWPSLDSHTARPTVLVLLCFLLLNGFTMLAVWQIGPGWLIVALFAFLLGLQLVAGISAILLARQRAGK